MKRGVWGWKFYAGSCQMVPMEEAGQLANYRTLCPAKRSTQRKFRQLKWFDL